MRDTSRTGSHQIAATGVHVLPPEATVGFGRRIVQDPHLHRLDQPQTLSQVSVANTIPGTPGSSSLSFQDHNNHHQGPGNEAGRWAPQHRVPKPVAPTPPTARKRGSITPSGSRQFGIRTPSSLIKNPSTRLTWEICTQPVMIVQPRLSLRSTREKKPNTRC